MLLKMLFDFLISGWEFWPKKLLDTIYEYLKRVGIQTYLGGRLKLIYLYRSNSVLTTRISSEGDQTEVTLTPKKIN
jgi:hypothetical protein